MSRENGAADREGGAIPPAEWAVAAIGAALVGVALVILIWNGMYGSESPPDVSLTVGRIHAVSAGYLVEVEVANRGASTAEALGIKGTLNRPEGGPAETSEAKLEFLPGESHQKVGLYFRSDPRKGILTLYAVGYQEP